jgi:hypothetical protein
VTANRLALVILYALALAIIALATAALSGCGTVMPATARAPVYVPDAQLVAISRACESLPAHVTLRRHTPVHVGAMTVWCSQ